ncbi:uncharacterized protein LOC133177792 [Saccostrea echinata]|uniref:uncharacterized protein LOC133177792 n=1 Tax=Saccostrea echinata TaxID=191078 RepID=UPI002A7EB0E7|nr:uncharacterized protein LOC133177792 [Saccostrea echinata]
MDPRTSAQDVMRCDLCETAVVQMHCDTCLINLCTACVGKHMISDESKDHKVVKFQDRKSTPLYPGCKTHKKERCKMFCKQCDIPVCISCIESNHHLGHELSNILRVLDEKKDIFIKERNELNDTIYPTYQDIASDVQNRMSQLEKEYRDLSTAITKHGEDWHREIDKLVKKLKAEVDEMRNTQLQTLQKHLDEINMKVSDIKDEINSTEIAINTNDMSKLISVLSKVHIYRNLPHKIVPSLPKLIPGKIQGEDLSKMFGTLSSSSLTSDKHGYIIKTIRKSPEAESFPPVKQLLDEPETVTTIDTGYNYKLYSVACLSDEEIWTRGDDSTMKLFSINQGSLLKSFKTNSGYEPFDIAVTKRGDLVYTDYTARTVNIVENEKIEEVIRLQNWRPYGVCSTSSGDLLVIIHSDDDKPSKVVRYSGFTEKQTIQFDDQGKPLYSSGGCYRYITENRNLDICVSDSGARTVVVVNQAGKLRFTYAGHTPAPKNKSFSLLGITTDSQSHILTADYNNDCVYIIDQDGQFLCYIDCGLNKPYGLCTDTNDNLFVAQWGNRQLLPSYFNSQHIMMDTRTSAQDVMRCDLCETAVTPQKSPEAGSSPPVKQLLDEPETVTTIDTGYLLYLNNVACLSVEEIWTRGNDRTMKLYSINQGSLLKSITTKSGYQPYDIAVTKSGDLVYTDDWDRTVNIVKNEKIEEVIRLQNWIPDKVCSTSSGDLLVILYSDDDKQTKVVRYSGSTEKQSIQFDDKGKPLYTSGPYYRYLTENRNLDICVSDSGSKAVVVVNQAGKLRFRYTGHTPAPKNKPFNPRGITTDSQSHIFTADKNNDCVHIIDQDGQFLRYIDCGLSGPWGLCTDTNDNLFIAQNTKKQVKKIKYLYSI